MSNRRQARRRQNQPQRRNVYIIGGVLALLVVAVGAVLALSGGAGSASAAVDDTRLNYDAYLGNPDAPVTLVEYGAYGCPACEAWHQAGIVDQLLDVYGDSLRFTFRDFPVIAPQFDQMTAQLAQCALDQDEGLYWQYHDALYLQADPGDSAGRLVALGEGIGLDGDALRACLDAGTHRATVQRDLDEARRLGLRGTPSFVINGQVVYNASPQALQQAIEQALR